MNTYQESFRIRYSDCDRYGKLKLQAVFDYAQEIAGNHAQRLGFGDQLRKERNLAWVLSRMKLRIREYPKSETQVKVTTWSSGYNRVFATRELRFTTGAEDRVFAEATSCWLLVNMETSRVAIPQRELAAFHLDEQGIERIFTDLDKLQGNPDAPVMGSFSIYEHQIDINSHLNNTEYASILQDAIGFGCYPTELQINYQKEIPPSSTVVVRGTREAGRFSLTGYLDGEESFNVIGLY